MGGQIAPSLNLNLSFQIVFEMFMIEMVVEASCCKA
jgi:hypothetical protein